MRLPMFTLSEKEFIELAKRNQKLQSCASSFAKKAQQKGPKYGNRKIYVHQSGAALPCKDETRWGPILERYDSEKEYRRYLDLVLLQKSGKIHALKRQEKILIQDSYDHDGEKIRAIYYKADFVFEIGETHIVEDVKPYDEIHQKFRTTRDFDIKWKLLKMKYPEWKFQLY